MIDTTAMKLAGVLVEEYDNNDLSHEGMVEAIEQATVLFTSVTEKAGDCCG